jgi:hypothetical protein
MDSRILHLSKGIRQYLDKVLFKIFSNKNEFKELYSRFNNKTVLVVGNGPSLNITPLDDFKDIPSIGMNKIDLLFKKTSWRPSLITVVNGTVILQHKHHFKSSSIPVFMDVKGYYLGFISKNINYFLSKYSSDFSKEYYKGLGSGGTVTYSALQLAFILGAKNVILFGVDHSFNQTGTKYVKSKGDDLNHFDPNYFGKGAVWGLPDLDACEVVYRKAKKAFEADGRKIYDATINGKLNIFPKISIEEAIKICQKS